MEAGLASYTDLYDFAPSGYFTLQSHGGIAQTNLAGARLLGLDRARLTGRQFGAFMTEPDRREALEVQVREAQKMESLGTLSVQRIRGRRGGAGRGPGEPS